MLTSLRSLLQGNVSKEDDVEESVVHAGAEILNLYQQQWAELHEINEANATKALAVTNEINKIHLKTTNDLSNITQIVQVLVTVPTLKYSIENCVSKIGNLYEEFEKVEKSLLTLEDLIEKVELEQRKSEHKYQLAVYKEKKLASFEVTRKNLAAKHTQNVVEHELKQKQILKERQQVFEDAFRDDLETYKSLGTLPKIEIHNNQQNALLEEILLDCDNKELDHFLEDT